MNLTNLSFKRDTSLNESRKKQPALVVGTVQY